MILNALGLASVDPASMTLRASQQAIRTVRDVLLDACQPSHGSQHQQDKKMYEDLRSMLLEQEKQCQQLLDSLIHHYNQAIYGSSSRAEAGPTSVLFDFANITCAMTFLQYLCTSRPGW